MRFATPQPIDNDAHTQSIAVEDCLPRSILSSRCRAAETTGPERGVFGGAEHRV